jgi:hypothetical protein
MCPSKSQRQCNTSGKFLTHPHSHRHPQLFRVFEDEQDSVVGSFNHPENRATPFVTSAWSFTRPAPTSIDRWQKAETRKLELGA